jgi:tetratricopeptide (TPR) repeat protein
MKSVATRGTSQSLQTCSSVALCAQRRGITRLYTSYYKGELYPNQLVKPTQTAGSSFRGTLKSGFAVAAASAAPPPSSESASPKWSDAHALDVLQPHQTTKDVGAVAPPARPYVPLQEAAEIELKGDYYLEGGLAQEALQCYGVVATLYSLAYPENHSQRAGIAIKLGTAFRRTDRLDSSEGNLEAALAMLDASTRPSLELIVECLMELGLTAEAKKDDIKAGALFEDVIAVVEAFHSSGESHRMLRLLPRLGRRFVLNVEEKFVYFSPFDCDRTFAIADQSLAYAEACYERTNNAEGIHRVLSARKHLIDRKYFNMRDFSGRIRTMRGHWMRRARHLTNAPTPEELFLYTPTVHQPHRDFAFEITAPIGLEHEVTPGTNRVVLDDASPYRKRKIPSYHDARTKGPKKAEANSRFEA